MKLLFTYTHLLLALNVVAQNDNIMLDNNQYAKFESQLNQLPFFHTSVKPYLHKEIVPFYNIDSARQSGNVLPIFADCAKEGQCHRYYLEVMPLLGGVVGVEPGDTINGIKSFSYFGFSMKAKVSKRLSGQWNFISAFTEQPSFERVLTATSNTVSSEGFAYPADAGVHHKINQTQLTYSASKYFDFQLGYGKNFWGDGYRSLLLSDIAPAYAYLRSSASIWKFKYVSLLASLKDIEQGRYYNSFAKKYGSFHYFSWKPTRKLNISLFEAVIWQGKDTLNERGFDINYANPLILYRPVEYSLGSADNSVLGFNVSYDPIKKMKLYGQVVVDEFLLSEIKARSGWWANKYGGQIGCKVFNPLNIEGLTLQGEVNIVRPFTYSHKSRLSNYGHFNQSLAHPLGANFQELISIVRYTRGNSVISHKLSAAKKGIDREEGVSYGGDIFKSYGTFVSEYGNTVGQGVSRILIQNELRFERLLLSDNNLIFEFGMINRVLNVEGEPSIKHFVFVGLRNSLWNRYNDY